MNEQIILASASPRRRELLDQIGVSYVVFPVDIDETPVANEIPRNYVKRVAAKKSAACIKAFRSKLPVLAADTSVVIDGEILGKPKNEIDATKMLSQLSGKTHSVYSAVSMRRPSTLDEQGHSLIVSKTRVKFKKLSVKEIQAYWQTGEPEGKAGAYAIQGLASVFIESIEGSFSGVVGLPLFETAELLFKQGIKIIK